MSSLPAGMFPRVAMSRHLLRRQGFGPQVAPGDSPIGIVVHVDYPVVALRQEPGCLAVVFPHLVGVPEPLPAPPLDSLKLLVLVVVQGRGEAKDLVAFGEVEDPGVSEIDLCDVERVAAVARVVQVRLGILAALAPAAPLAGVAVTIHRPPKSHPVSPPSVSLRLYVSMLTG